MIKKRIALGAVMIIALCAGIWFLVSPSLNRQADLDEQRELLEEIMALLPSHSVVNTDIEIPVNKPVDDDDDDVSFIDDAVDEPSEPEEIIEYAPPLVPLNHEDFPSDIIPIGILTIDSIDLTLPVMDGIDEQKLRVAPGRVPQTADVGEPGNSVIAGHRNYTFGQMFNRLGEIENGDVIRFQAMSGEIMAFEVFEILVINPDDQIAFIQPQNESIITLYTCTPVREATHRLLVRAIKI